MRLPDGARPLANYGRNYALDRDGKVIGTYLIPLGLDTPGSDEVCEVELEDFQSRPCTQQEMNELSEGKAEYAASETPAGTSRWVEDPRDLPGVNDGGCTQITIEYEISTRRFLRVECNGEA